MAIKGTNRRLGFFGERRAVRYLKSEGYTVLERNYRCKSGEIDVIAQKGEVVAFIEVKTRSGDAFGTPAEAVGPERQRRYKNTAKYYFYGKQVDFIVRFDIIEIIANGHRYTVNHIENAFY